MKKIIKHKHASLDFYFLSFKLSSVIKSNCRNLPETNFTKWAPKLEWHFEDNCFVFSLSMRGNDVTLISTKTNPNYFTCADIHNSL